MLHVRVVSPAELTGLLLTRLAAHSGVRNLVLLRGTAQLPDGDAIQFDLLNASANPVLHDLRSLGLDRRGSVTVGEVNVALDGPPTPAAERRYARREQVPVWEMVKGIIQANAGLPGELLPALGHRRARRRGGHPDQLAIPGGRGAWLVGRVRSSRPRSA